MSYEIKPNCPWRKPPKHPMDHALRIAHVVGGMMFGALASSFIVIELSFGILISEKGSLWIPFSIMAGAVVVSGVLAWIFGEKFIDWMEENWHRFRNHHHT